MALLFTLQRTIVKQCHGSRHKILPFVTRLTTPLYVRELSTLKSFQSLTQIKPISIRSFAPKHCTKFPLPNEIHTSASRKAIPPIIWIFLRPILNVSVIIFGKLFKKWWKKQPPESKAEFWNKLKRNKHNILGGFGVFGLLGMLYYFMHLELAPITNRKRFMMLHNKDMEQITNQAVEALNEVYGNQIMPVMHPYYRQVERVMKRILMANRETLAQQDISKLRIHVVETPDKNAVVLPNCTVFIYSGIFELCHNDDQLAAVLSHELAHAVLNHQAEMLSKEQVFDTLMLIVLLFVWATFPDAAAFLWQLISMSMSQLLVKLPFSREMELEADAVGLKMMARACFDVREAASVWGKLSYLEEKGLNEQPPEIMSTHPANKKRQDILESLIPDAVKYRDECKCQRLPSSDPRVFLELWKRDVDAMLTRQKLQHNMPGFVKLDFIAVSRRNLSVFILPSTFEFPPTQLAQPYIANAMWESLLKLAPDALGDQNPYNEWIKEVFIDQEGH